MDYNINNFFLRLVVSLPLIGIASISLYLGPKYASYLISLIFFIIFYEWNYLFIKKSYYKINTQTILLIFFFLSLYLNILLSIIFFIIYIIISIYFNNKSKFNYLYIIINLYLFISIYSSFNLLYIKLETSQIIIFLFFVIISFDSFSYFFGKLIKGKKIIPKISPGKTISGYIGGIVCSFIIGILINNYYNIVSNIYFLIVIIFITILSAIIGDIIESIIKRKLNIKDISNFLPGHGGFFDRFDAFILVFIISNLSYSILIN